jgi:hypothetical protein
VRSSGLPRQGAGERLCLSAEYVEQRERHGTRVARANGLFVDLNDWQDLACRARQKRLARAEQVCIVQHPLTNRDASFKANFKEELASNTRQEA